MIDLAQKISNSAAKTINFFASKLTENGSYGNEIQDLCCYYKSPSMFIVANRYDLALRSLNYIYDRFMTNEGDFKTDSSIKSSKPEYIEYWSYINGWIIRAANKLDQKRKYELASKFLLNFYCGKDAGFSTNYFSLKNGITDVFTTAHHGFLYLEQENFDLALSAGNYLCSAILSQPDLDEKFYTRINSFGAPITVYEKNNAIFYCIEKKQSGQFYFKLGYSSAYLISLYKKTGVEKYLDAAISYFDFLFTCQEDVFSNKYSHKVAWGATLLFNITNNKKYFTAVEKIMDYYLQRQVNGVWYLNEDINTTYEQSPEIALWFLEISKILVNSNSSSK